MQVDDVNAGALTVNETLHLRVPATGLMPEMDAGFQQLLHGNNCHDDLPVEGSGPDAEATGCGPDLTLDDDLPVRTHKVCEQTDTMLPGHPDGASPRRGVHLSREPTTIAPAARDRAKAVDSGTTRSRIWTRTSGEG